MEEAECFQRHTKAGPDYHHQPRQTKNSDKMGRLRCWGVILVPAEWSVECVAVTVLIIPATTDITLTVSTFKGSPASPPPPPPAAPGDAGAGLMIC